MDAVTLAMIKGLGGGSSLPSVTSSDNGKVLAVKDGAWAAQQKKFIVTLTPTSLDYSGTTDKTVAEINAAYEAGQQIVFSITASGFTVEMPVDGVGKADGVTYPSFESKFIANNGVFVRIYTGATDNGTRQTYSTEVYSLTPAS